MGVRGSLSTSRSNYEMQVHPYVYTSPDAATDEREREPGETLKGLDGVFTASHATNG